LFFIKRERGLLRMRQGDKGNPQGLRKNDLPATSQQKDWLRVPKKRQMPRGRGKSRRSVLTRGLEKATGKPSGPVKNQNLLRQQNIKKRTEGGAAGTGTW